MMKLGYRSISLIYVLIGLLWITFGDNLLYLLRYHLNESTILLISSGKRCLLVLLTGLLMYTLIKSYNKRLKSSEAQYRTIYEGNPLPMWIYEPNTLKFVSVNETAVTNYGYSREQFLAMSILDIRPPEDTAKVKSSVQYVSKNFKQSGIWKHLKADGTQIFVTISSQQILFNNKPHIMVVVSDITEKVEFEQKLKKLNDDLSEEKRKLSETQQVAKVAGWELYLEDKRLVWSDELYIITGIEPAAGKNLFDVYVEHIHPDDRPQMIAWLELLVSSGRQLDITHRITFPNQDTIRYVRHIARVEYLLDKPYKVVGSMQDITEVKNLELERNRYLFSWEDTLNNMSEGFCALNKEMVIIQANKRFELETKMTDTHVIGKSLAEIFPGIENTITYKEFQKALQKKITVRFETYSEYMNKWISTTAYPTEEGLAVYFNDITKQKEKDLKLKEAVERYELVSKATRDIIYDYDIQQDRLVYNDNSSLLFNDLAKQMGGSFQWWQSIIHFEDQVRFIRTQQKAIESQQSNWSCEYRIDCGGGNYKYVYDQGYFVYNENNELVRIIGAIKDINALKLAYYENKRLADIITKVNNMVMVLDTQSRITWVNKAFEDYTGYKANRILGRQPNEFLIGPNTSTETLAYIERCKSRFETFSVEIIHYIQNKQQWVETEYTPLFDDFGRHTGYIAVHQNITIRKQKQEQIEKQNLALQKIAWLSSHEIRRPLASILGLINLNNETDSPEEKEDILHLINHCAQELDEIVHDITRRVQEEAEQIL